MNSESILQTSVWKSEADYLAPDVSEIRMLLTMRGGGLCHCTLPAGKTSSPVEHQHVEEIWYVLEGEGEVWRKGDGGEDTVRVSAGTTLTIPPRTAFQFRNTGTDPLCILIVTMPPWPGPQEAVKAEGLWIPTITASAEPLTKGLGEDVFSRQYVQIHLGIKKFFNRKTLNTVRGEKCQSQKEISA